MAYTTVEDLRLALAPSGDTGPSTAASLSDPELTDAISEAQQEIDARLSSGYTVPFVPVPGLVAQITRDLAAFKATLVHRRGNPLDARDPIQLRYTHAMDLLKQIAAGDVDLIGAAGEDIQTGGAATVIQPYEGDMFTLPGMGLGAGTYGPGLWP